MTAQPGISAMTHSQDVICGVALDRSSLRLIAHLVIRPYSAPCFEHPPDARDIAYSTVFIEAAEIGS